MRYLLPVLLFLNSFSFGQSSNDTIQYPLDFNWNSCDIKDAYYYRVVYKEDRYWHLKDYYLAEKTLQFDGMFADKNLRIGEGMHYWYYPNGQIQDKIRFVHGKRMGINKGYSENGKLTDSILFVNDTLNFAFSWYETGQQRFNAIYDKNGEGYITAYYENGNIDSIGKNIRRDVKDSIWSYFYESGVVSCKDYYYNGKKIKRECFDETGTLLDKPCADFEGEMPQMDDIYKTFSFIKDYAATSSLNLIIRVCIDKNGKLSGKMVRHVQRYFDKEMEEAFAKCPNIKVPIYYNRPFRQYCETTSYYLKATSIHRFKR